MARRSRGRRPGRARRPRGRRGRRGAGTARTPRRDRRRAMPGPWSTTRRSTRVADRAGLDADRASPAASSAARWRPGWRRPARAGRGRPTTGGSVSATSIRPDRPRSSPEAGQRRGHDLVEPTGRQRRLRARRSGGGSCRAGCRRGSSSRSVSSSMVSRNSACRSGGPVDVVLQQARHRRLDRGQRRAQVVGHRPQERGAELVRPRRSSSASARLACSRALLERRRQLGGEGVQHPLVVAAQRARPVSTEHGVLVDRERRPARSSGWPRRVVAGRRPRATQPPSRRTQQADGVERRTCMRRWSDDLEQRRRRRRRAPPASAASASASAPARARVGRPGVRPAPTSRLITAGDDARKATSASRFSRSAMVNVWSGSVKNQLTSSDAGHGGDQGRRRDRRRSPRRPASEEEQQIGREAEVGRGAVTSRR